MKQQWTEYELSTGVLSGRSIFGDKDLLLANAVDGFGWLPGLFDSSSMRVDLLSGDLVPCLTPAPEPAADYQWRPERGRWVLTAAAAERNRKRTAARAEVERLERDTQPRIIRELRLAELAGEPPPQDAVRRLEQLDARIAELRKDL